MKKTKLFLNLTKNLDKLMRIRTIKPEFWSHPVIGKMSESTKLMAIGLLNVADDDGYFYADARLIRNAIRPFDDQCGITTVSIRELSEVGWILIKNHPTHGEIGYVVNFSKHQVINKAKPSKLKGLFEECTDTVSIPYPYHTERNREQGAGNGMEHDLLSVVTDEPSIESEIKTIWQYFNSKSRERSSIKQLSAEWKKTKNKPKTDDLIKSIELWNNSKEWTKDNRQFASGAHLFIKNRKWEVIPEAYNPNIKHGTGIRPLND